MSFRLPYHFYPIRKRSQDRDVPVSDGRSTPRLGHHHYAEGTYSGRIVCRLTNETEMFIGAERTPGEGDQPATVAPYKLDGEPAIPASSLRGLISSLAEAASNSAARVLDDGPLSFRKFVDRNENENGPLSAIGMVVEEEDEKGNTELRLRPICLPTLGPPNDGLIRVPWSYQKCFRGRPLHFKVYVGNAASIRNDAFAYRTFRLDSPEFYGLRLVERWADPAGFPLDEQLHARGGRVLSQLPLEAEQPRPWGEIPPDERSAYTRGIVRVLGVWGRGDVPNTKHHELFLPYPEDAERWITLPFAEGVVERFEELADQRTKEWASQRRGDPLPYEPKDTERNEDGSSEDPDSWRSERLRLKAGDLVYFRPDNEGNEILEVSFSSIWRGRIEREPGKKASTRTFFEILDPDLVPFHSGRERVTPAEQVFGFVSTDRDDQRVPLPALKGRVRFSAGRLIKQAEDGPYQPPVTLKILASPKPPSAALYFREKGGEGYLANTELTLNKHEPQGRKVYLRRKVAAGSTPWETGHPRERTAMKSRITPLCREQEFVFHVDFANLSQVELGMLCYALRPEDGFRHKLGMGKPLGLGTVRIDPLGLFYIDRRERYGEEGFFGPRYHSCWLGQDDLGEPVESRYSAEAECAGSAAEGLSFQNARSSFTATMGPNLGKVIGFLGSEEFEDIRPPMRRHQVDPETDTYEWFVQNNRTQGEGLTPLDVWAQDHPEPENEDFPSLERN